MPLPILCASECLQQYLMSYRDLFSKPQYKYFVIVLLGFMQCQQARTLSGLQRSVAEAGKSQWSQPFLYQSSVGYRSASGAVARTLSHTDDASGAG